MDLSKLDIAAIVPCHNEEGAIAKVVADLLAAVPTMRVFVYDNCSTDRTAEVAAAAGAIVRREERKGKGNVVRRAFADVEADIYVMIDGDDTYDAAALPDAVDLLSERKIRLFSIYGADDQQSYQYELEQTPEESREELKTLTEKQGKGRFYDVEDSGTGGDIVKQLEKTEVSALGGRKQTRRTDVPQMPIITLSLVLLGYLGLTTWRRA